MNREYQTAIEDRDKYKLEVQRLRAAAMTTEDALAAIRAHIGGCREELPGGDRCWEPAEYVLWGKLIPPKGLGPRCYKHAARHVDPYGLRSGTTYALIHLRDLAEKLQCGGES